MIDTKTIIEINCNDGSWQKAVLIIWSEESVDNEVQLWTEMKGFSGPYLQIASNGTGPIDDWKKKLHYLLDNAIAELEYKRLESESL